MTTEIKTVAALYARDEMGREVVGILDHGSHALALCAARDGEESFSLVLYASIASHEWGVVEETDVNDFRRNAYLDSAMWLVDVAEKLELAEVNR